MKVGSLFIFYCFMGIFIFISPSQVMSEVEEAQAPLCTYAMLQIGGRDKTLLCNPKRCQHQICLCDIGMSLKDLKRLHTA